jgi:ribosomal protein S7
VGSNPAEAMHKLTIYLMSVIIKKRKLSPIWSYIKVYDQALVYKYEEPWWRRDNARKIFFYKKTGNKKKDAKLRLRARAQAWKLQQKENRRIIRKILLTQKITYLFKMFLYSSPFITKLICGFMQRGKKNLMYRLWNTIFTQLKDRVRVSPLLFFKRQLLTYRPLFKMKKQNIGKTIKNMPIIISAGQQLSVMYKMYIAFLKKNIKRMKNSKGGFSDKMCNILLFDFYNKKWSVKYILNEIHNINRLAFKHKHYLMNKSAVQNRHLNITAIKKKRISVPI